jgi:hypothetical protein
MEISWAKHVKNKEALHRVKEKRNILLSRIKEGYLDLSHLAQELPPESCY